MSPPQGKNYRLNILDDQGNLVPNQPASSPAGQAEIGTYIKNSANNTRLIIKVEGVNGDYSNEDYELAFTFTENCLPNDPNDLGQNSNSATPFFSQTLTTTLKSKSYNGFINSTTDEDYTSFTIQGGGILNIGLQNLPANFDMQLLDNAGIPLASSQTPGLNGEEIVYPFQAGTNTTVYLRVYGSNSAFDNCQAYNLDVSWTPGTGCLDLMEPNDTRPSASTNIPSLNLNPITNFQLDAPLFQNDQDLYRLDVDAQGTLTADLSNLPVDYEIQLLDNNGNIIASNPQTGTTPEQVSFAYTSQQVTTTFYLKVVGVNGAYDECNKYRITFNWNPTNSCLDNFEPNEDIANAAVNIADLGLVAGNQIIQSKIRSITDTDYFEVNLLEEGTLTLDLTNLPVNYDLKVWEAGNINPTFSSTNTGTTSEQIVITHTGSSNITYYIQVESAMGAFDPCNSYQLGLSWVPLNACIPPANPPDLTAPGSQNPPGLMVSTTTPVFEWISVPGATSYELRIFEEPYSSNNLIYSQCVGPSPFTLPVGILEGGKKYAWNLQPKVDCGTCVGPTSLFCYFRVDGALAPSCTGITTLTAPSGNFSDGSGPDNYDNFARCSWLIDVPGATSISLELSEFDVEYNYDYLLAFDGSSINDPVLGIYTGDSLPPRLRSTSGEMLVVFFTDAYTTRPGWSATYTARFAEIENYEYWFDEDYTNKVTSSVGLNGDFLDTSFPTTGLTEGLHTLHIRFQDDLKQWSSVISQYFQKLPEFSNGVPKIVSYEYWFDEDYAGKVQVPLTPSKEILTLDSLDVTSLTRGLHTFHIRYKDELGRWSSVLSQYIHKLPDLNGGKPELVSFEYWFDDDYSNKASVSLTPSQDILTLDSLDLTTLTRGLHTFHIRYKDNLGQWTSVLSQYIHKLGNPPPTLPNLIVGYRYFFDQADSAMVRVKLPTAVNPLNLVTDIDATGITPGSHTIHFQFEDTAHYWSSVLTDTFLRVAAPRAIFSVSDSAICQGESISFTNNSTESDQYLWDFGDGTTSTDPNPNHIYQTGGLYSVSLVSTNGTFSVSDTLIKNQLIQVSDPQVSITGSNRLCVGDSITLIASGTQSYSWSPSASLLQDTGTTVVAIPPQTLNYQVIGTDAQGCSDTSTYQVLVDTLPMTPVLSLTGVQEVCQGDSLQLNGPVGFSTYEWSRGDTTQDIYVGQPGFFALRVTDANGCQSSFSDSTELLVNSLPTKPVIDSLTTLTVCQGDTIKLFAPMGFDRYSWSSGDSTRQITLLVSQSVTVSVEDSNGCSSQLSDPINVVVNPLPLAPQISQSGPLSFCEGGNINLTPTGPFAQYLWSNGANGPNITVDSTANIWLQVVDTNGCISPNSDTLIITANALPPVPSISANGPLTFCPGAGVSISGPSGYTYLWSTGDTTQQISINDSVRISLTITDQNGCERLSVDTLETMVLAKPPLPLITLNGSSEFCEGDSVELVSTSSQGYLWSTGDSAQSITVSDSGIFTLVSTNLDGCRSDTAFSPPITVYPNPLKPIISLIGSPQFCEGDSLILTGPSSFSTYYWNTGDSVSSITVLDSGAFVLQVQDSNQCLSPLSDSVLAIAYPKPEIPSIVANGPLEFCEGDEVNLSTIPNDYAAFRWSNQDTFSIINVTQSGAYSVIVLNDFGCSSNSIDSIIVDVISKPDTPIIELIGIDTLRSSVTGTSYHWYKDGSLLNDSTQVIVAQGGGDYVVVVFNDSCESAPSDTLELIISSFIPAEKPKIEIFPNPTSKTVYLQGSHLDFWSVDVAVYGANGQLVYEEKVLLKEEKLRASIDVSNWARSVYQLVIKAPSGEIITSKKLVVSN
ncbi:MAG: CUB domain-containing protein [Bacteroidota bacterium]